MQEGRKEETAIGLHDPAGSQLPHPTTADIGKDMWRTHPSATLLSENHLAAKELKWLLTSLL